MESQAQSVEEPEICPGCGILWLEDAEACKSCKTPGPPIRGVEQPGHGFWTGVRATFTCNACRFDSPLNHFELGEGVTCMRCGLEQKFDQRRWHELGALAHAVGDLGAGGPQGRFPDEAVAIENPHAALARHGGWARRDQLRATPGNPLCRACSAPMRFVQRDGNETEVVCAGCGTTRRYELPETASRIKGLVAVLADEHEAGGAEVRVQDETGTVALACPGCGAPLHDIRDVDGVITCTYCQATCRISTQTHARAGHKNTPVKTWWLYFDTPSKARNKLVDEARKNEAKKRRGQEKAAQRKRSREQQGPGAKHEPAKKVDHKQLLPVYGLVAVMLSAIPLYIVIMKPFAPVEDPDAGKPSDAVLAELSFHKSQAEIGELLGVQGAADMTVELEADGVFSKARVTLGGPGSGPTRGLYLDFGSAFDAAAAEQRFDEISPNRWRVSEAAANKGLLRLSATRLEIMTWLKDDAEASARADALWAGARYLAYGEPRPTEAQLRLINGPSLTDLGTIDLSAPVEKAVGAVQATAPEAACASVNEMVLDGPARKIVRCTVDVNHFLFKEASLVWPNAPESEVLEASFTYATQRGFAVNEAVAPCLESVLGAGEKVVTDHATGAGYLQFSLGAAGDRVELGQYFMKIVGPEPGAGGEGAPGEGESEGEGQPSADATWPARFPELMKALDGCKK